MYGAMHRRSFNRNRIGTRPDFLVISSVCFLATATGYSQPRPQPRFEVASIKPAGDVFSTKPERSGGRIRWTTQLCYLVGYAERLDSSRVSGPKCGSIYSIEAIFDPAATEDQVRLMVQALLSDRFKMRSHRVTTEANGYALTIGKTGLKIREVKVGDEPPPMPEWVRNASIALKAESYIAATSSEPGVIEVTGRRASMLQLAETLARSTGMPVWDRTGLSGSYYFALRYAQDLDAELKTDAPSLTTSIKENLGLKLERQKGPVETLVIDNIQEPSEN